VRAEDLVVGLFPQQQAGLRQLEAHEHREGACDEEQGERRREILDADHLMIGGEAEVTTPVARRPVRVMLFLDVHLPPGSPYQPEAEGADSDQETDQREEIAEPEDFAVRDLHPGNARENQRPRTDHCTDGRAEDRAYESWLQCSHGGDCDPLGGGWLPLGPGDGCSQASRAARSLTTVVKRMSVWPKPHSSAHRPG
jgi:hypothetical protein